jgi:hypothetical protein
MKHNTLRIVPAVFFAACFPPTLHAAALTEFSSRKSTTPAKAGFTPKGCSTAISK